MPTFVKIETGIVDKNIFDQYIPDHKKYVRDLIERGHKARTGYWAEYGGGMLLFEADSLKEAKNIVSNDPLIKNNCVTYKLHEWVIIDC